MQLWQQAVADVRLFGCSAYEVFHLVGQATIYDPTSSCIRTGGKHENNRQSNEASLLFCSQQQCFSSSSEYLQERERADGVRERKRSKEKAVAVPRQCSNKRFVRGAWVDGFDIVQTKIVDESF